MNEKVRVYKTLDKLPLLYIEVEGIAPPFDLEVYLDSKLVNSFTSKKNNNILDIEQSGTYHVLVNNSKTSLKSNQVCLYPDDFNQSSEKEKKITKLKGTEPVFDEIKSFYIEIKVLKEDLKSLNKIAEALDVKTKLQRKKINTDSFHASHSIHHYEYYEIHQKMDRVKAVEICQKIEELDSVVYCSIVPVTDNLPPPNLNMRKDPLLSDNTNRSDTPDFSELQKYLDEPQGMNIRSVWDKEITGQSVTIRHLDFGIYRNHEDFQGGNITVVTSRDESSDCNHGTASTGCIAAAKNDFGVTGIAHSSSYFFYDTGDVDKILEQANAGDIVSLDIQFKSEGKLIPVISSKHWWDTIKNMVEKKVIVIMAAGNGALDLSDTSVCTDYGDSGAILVGSSYPDTGKKLTSSNYGHYSSLINSWGTSVTTTGYSSLQKLPGNNRNYTLDYSGTSSATPLCAGALALLQSYAKQQGVVLTPGVMKDILTESNYTEGVHQKIGKRPNVEQLLTIIDRMILSPLVDTDPFPPSTNYSNHNVFFFTDVDYMNSIFIDYTNSEIMNSGVVAHYAHEGPVSLEWKNPGEATLKLPVIDREGDVYIVYLQASKYDEDDNSFTMNSTADGLVQYNLVLKFNYSENKYLPAGEYRGILPLYIKSWEYPEYSLPLKINVTIE